MLLFAVYHNCNSMSKPRGGKKKTVGALRRLTNNFLAISMW